MGIKEEKRSEKRSKRRRGCSPLKAWEKAEEEGAASEEISFLHRSRHSATPKVVLR